VTSVYGLYSVCTNELQISSIVRTWVVGYVACRMWNTVLAITCSHNSRLEDVPCRNTGNNERTWNKEPAGKSDVEVEIEIYTFCAEDFTLPTSTMAS